VRRNVAALLRLVSQVTVATCLLTIVTIEYVRPWVAYLWYQGQYRKLTLECDLAMHDEVALRADTTGASKHPLLAVSGAVGLTVCHDYDKLRKELLILGVSEDRLALMGLEVLEAEQITVDRMIDPHRMERF
jgi:hypothetical protein